MRNVPSWMPALHPAGGPAYLQIVAALEAALAQGVLRPGDRLPPQRALAKGLGVDLGTVTRAYAEAHRRHLLDGVTGRGSFVSAAGERTAAPVDLSMNIPPPPAGLRLADLLADGLSGVIRRASADMLMSYHAGPGALAERAAAAAWLAPGFGALDPDRIVVAPGAQAGLAALLTSLARPGDTILCEALTYPGLRNAAGQLGLTLAGVAADADGPCPDALAQACRRHRPKAFYLVPTIANPTARTLSEARRRALADTARAEAVPVIEDDPYWRLAGDAPPPLAALRPEAAYHLATLSKALSPGLRTAFLVAPSVEAAGRMARALRALNQMPAPLMTALVTAWIRDGSAAALLAGVRREAAARQEVARAILPAEAQAHPFGLHVWLPLPERWDRLRLVEAARRAGLGLAPADAFHVSGPVPDAVRLSLGSVPDRARLARALTQLVRVLGAPAEPAYDVV
ncbi:PLP-dependent aminotransferase family protein [Xanthobacter sp. KR7-225]|uniref:aminotransferase-like domain-containing protein n=1 Tax=Xanthobacter sp. KR7-225 TaxID=3156613 RepID=UPI0032B332D2